MTILFTIHMNKVVLDRVQERVSRYTRPCYVDVEFSYYSTAKKLKVSFGSNIDQGVMPGVGNGQLNEYWGFSGLKLMRTSLRPLVAR